MISKDLDKIIKLHKKWIAREAEGIHADLSYADLKLASLVDVDLSEANLAYADLFRVDLSYANFRGADLCHANLSSTYLRNANLRNVYLRNTNGNLRELKSMKIETYSIYWTKETLQIGCKKHTFDEWRNFTNEEILNMDGEKALNFWIKWKEFIFKAIEMSKE